MALWVAIESVVIPIPSELVLPFAGFLAADPDLGRAAHRLGVVDPAARRRRDRRLARRCAGRVRDRLRGGPAGPPPLGPRAPLTEDDLDRTEAFFERWGPAAAFLGRMVPVVRSLVSFGAGVGRMRLLPFVCFTVLGSIPWNLALVLAGYALGERWAHVEVLLAQFESVVIVGLALVALAWVWLRFVARLGAADLAE